MSTKTTIKRIALVAAVAAAFGGLSTVAANATANSLPVVTNSSTAVAALASTATETTTVTATDIVGTYNAISLTPGQSDSYYTITTSGAGTVSYPSSAPAGTTLTAQSSTTEIWSNGAGAIGAVTPNAGTTSFGSGSNNSGSNYNALTVSVNSAVAGTQTITYTGNVTGVITETITWGAASAVSAANSTSGLAAGTTTPTQGTNATVVASDAAQTAAASAAANIVVVPEDQYKATLASEKLTVTVSGPGTVGISSTQGGAASAGRALTGTAGQYTINVFGDGTPGVSTITISDGTVVLATDTVTFYGNPATAVASNNNYVLAAGSTKATTVELYLTDANGNPVSGVASQITGTAASTTVVSAVGACVADTTSSAHANAAGYYTCSVTAGASATSGASTTITYVVNNSTATAVLATAAPVTISIGGATIASIVLTTDSSSYVPGNLVTVTLTAKDSSGNPVADGAYPVFKDVAVGSIGTAEFAGFETSAQITSAIFNTTDAGLSIKKGAATATFYAPYADGTVSLSATLPSTNTYAGIAAALEGTTVAGSFSVTTGASSASSAATDAANEATDAANAATDAANAAADAADAATQAAQDASAQAQAALAAVNALSAKITVLAAQIAKIVKKLGA